MCQMRIPKTVSASSASSVATEPDGRRQRLVKLQCADHHLWAAGWSFAQLEWCAECLVGSSAKLHSRFASLGAAPPLRVHQGSKGLCSPASGATYSYDGRLSLLLLTASAFPFFSLCETNWNILDSSLLSPSHSFGIALVLTCR